MSSRKHPIKQLEKYFANFGKDALIRLSTYTYRPNQIEDKRHSIKIPCAGLGTTLEEWGKTLPRTVDLAIHSEIWGAAGQPAKQHLILIDLCGAWRLPAEAAIASELKNAGCERASIYRSGRSFHVYGMALLNQWKWEEFMCRLLLANPIVQAQWLTQRQIGEGLLAASAARRSFAQGDDGAAEVAKEIMRALIWGFGQNQESRAKAEEKYSTRFEELEQLWKQSCALLLANPPSDAEYVDSRWIGHRLRAGFASLRWTSHQRQYLAEPTYWRDLQMR